MSTVAPWIGWPPTVSTTRTRKASGTPGRPSVMFLRTMSGSRAYGPAAGCGVSVHADAGAAAVAGSAVPTTDVMPARLSVAAPAAVSAPRRLNTCEPVVSSFSIRYPPYLDKTVKPMLSGTGDVDRPFADIRWSRGDEPARAGRSPRARCASPGSPGQHVALDGVSVAGRSAGPPEAVGSGVRGPVAGRPDPPALALRDRPGVRGDQRGHRLHGRDAGVQQGQGLGP